MRILGTEHFCLILRLFIFLYYLYFDTKNLRPHLSHLRKGGNMSIISVNNLTFGYNEQENNIFNDVSFNLDTNWKLGLIRKKWKRKNNFFKYFNR